jgi:predicted transposase/invertase (TIGR01784 family)
MLLFVVFDRTHERMGIEQGIEQGEDRATQKIALNMLQENIPLETIARITGLTIDQLQQLQALSGNDRSN